MAYIEREALDEFRNEIMYKFIQLCYGNDYNKLTLLRISDTIDSIYEKYSTQPAADVVEVKHEKWLYHECVSSNDGAISGYSCSHCGAFVDEEEFESEEFHKKFCGNCGAKMDGKDGEK